MTYCVKNPNIVNEKAPTSLDELVKFVDFVKNLSYPIFVQLSGYEEEVVRKLAVHFEVNFFDHVQLKSIDINPFCIIYIDQEGQIKSRCIHEKSKIVIYAKRTNPNHH